MKSVVLIGVGTEDREDDAVGLQIVRQVPRERFPFADIRESRGDGARLLSLWKGYHAAIIVDAIHSASPPGTLHRIDLSTYPLPRGYECSSSHQFGVNEAVETARMLGELPEELVLIGVEVERARIGKLRTIRDDLEQRLLLSIESELERFSPAAAGSVP